ncbi:MAG TPA: hypothetical protein V6C86_21860 [Oculatellaceae cyanobacterium]
MKTVRFFGVPFFWIFGVLTCAFYAVVTERITMQSSNLGVLFLPLFFIPIANAAALIVTKFPKPNPTHINIVGSLNTLAYVAAIALTIVLSPLWILDGITILILLLSAFFSPFVALFGLIPLFYFFVATGPIITTKALRDQLKSAMPKDQKIRWLSLGTSFAVTIAIILIGAFPISFTSTCSQAVTTGTAVMPGLLLLRAIGDEQQLLRACYKQTARLPWFFEPMGGLDRSAEDYDYSNTKLAAHRELYYRITGKPFNSKPRPIQKHDMFSGDFFAFGPSDDEYYDDYNYYDYWHGHDFDFAGEAVGGVVKGLVLQQSTIQGWVDPNETVAHLTWNMRFKGINHKSELRTQLLLPPHAVVTGCSLFINGERHDAVFAERNSSRIAYRSAAEAGEKPLLVSTAGADRVLIQSSTGWWSTESDLIVDITAPLVVTDHKKAALPLPVFAERNFEIGGDHQVLLHAFAPIIKINAPSLESSSDNLKSNTPIIRGKLKNSELANGRGTILFERDSSFDRIYAQDNLAEGSKKNVIQNIDAVPHSADTPLVIVVDGSDSMSKWTSSLCDNLDKISFKNVSLIWASDEPLTIIKNANSNSNEWHTAIKRLRDSSCIGGQNNAQALIDGVHSLSESQGNVVWLHAPQPVGFAGNTLVPILRHSNGKIKLYEYQMESGPNEVVKSLDSSNALEQVPKTGTAAEDLSLLFNQLSGQQATYKIQREFVDKPIPAGMQSRHPAEIAQLAVGQLVLKNLLNTGMRNYYGSLAEDHNVVTPLTSALVLQHQSDYEKYQVQKHAKKHSAAETSSDTHTSNAKAPQVNNPLQALIPSKPEPPQSLLIATAVLCLGLFQLFRRNYKNKTS